MAQPDKLHLGAYNIVYEGWLNTDVTLQLWVARVPLLATLLYKLGRISADTYQRHRAGIFHKIRYLNVTKRFPFADNSFRYVFSSHMLEHLYPEEALHCLRETFRVLQPGGLVRISIPDLDLMIAEYDPRDPDTTLFSIFQGDRRKTPPRFRHWWHYNEHSLRRILSEIGFSEVERCDYRQGRCADVERIDNRPGSLFIEAIK